MILLCGIPSEPPVAFAIRAAEELGVDHVVFNQREASFSDLWLEVGRRGVRGAIHIRGRDHALEDFTGVYTRLTDPATLPEHRLRGRRPPDAKGLERSTVVHAALGEWLDFAPCSVVNRARDMASNASKPYQAQLIAGVGFATPSTLVTNDPEDVERFAHLRGPLIYKSTSSVRSIVRELDAEGRAALPRVRNLPTQFQSRLMGTNIRVHVAGQEVFATEIVCDAVDYRYAEHDDREITMRPVELPSEIARRSRRLAIELRLPFCGIDLMRTEGGTYYCFEVNPSPAFSYYESNTGQPIARALVRYLAGLQSEDLTSDAPSARIEGDHGTSHRELG